MATRSSASSTGMTFHLKHRYTFVDAVYTGPMTTIYRGVWDFFDREVYIASAEGLLGLKPTSSTTQRVFSTIAEEAGAIQGKYLPDIVDSSRIDKITAVVVMRLPAGQILSQWIERHGTLSADQTYKILRGVAQALQQCRVQAGPHRGPTPDRVWLCEDGTPILLGYGEALRRREINHLSGHTANEIWWHTPPEVLRDAGDGNDKESSRLRAVIGSEDLPDLEDSPQAEVWNLGALAYYCLTGHHPYYVIANDHQHGIINTLQQIRLPLPDEHAYLQPVIDRALAATPVDRFDSPTTMASEFYAIIHPGTDEASVITGPQPIFNSAPNIRPSAPQKHKTQDAQGELRSNLWRTTAIALTIALLMYAWMDVRRPRSLILTSEPNGIEIIETTGHVKTPRGRTPIMLSHRRLGDPITLQSVNPSGDLGDPITILPRDFADLGRCAHAELLPDFSPTSKMGDADGIPEPADTREEAPSDSPDPDHPPISP